MTKAQKLTPSGYIPVSLSFFRPSSVLPSFLLLLPCLSRFFSHFLFIHIVSFPNNYFLSYFFVLPSFFVIAFLKYASLFSLSITHSSFRHHCYLLLHFLFHSSFLSTSSLFLWCLFIFYFMISHSWSFVFPTSLSFSFFLFSSPSHYLSYSRVRHSFSFLLDLFTFSCFLSQ